MAAVSRAAGGGAFELATGDHMTREEFHRVYVDTAEDFHAELIGGIVYVASPVRRRHGVYQLLLGGLLAAYAAETPGVEAGDNATILLGEDAEPQPDLYVRIVPEAGGQTRTTTDDYIEGAPEFVAEIAHGSRAIDLHAKKDDYTRYGVQEYVVVSVGEARLRWFDLHANRELDVPDDGIVRLASLPGLWVASGPLFAGDHAALMHVLARGLATPAHAEFVRRLATR